MILELNDKERDVLKLLPEQYEAESRGEISKICDQGI